LATVNCLKTYFPSLYLKVVKAESDIEIYKHWKKGGIYRI